MNANVESLNSKEHKQLESAHFPGKRVGDEGITLADNRSVQRKAHQPNLVKGYLNDNRNNTVAQLKTPESSAGVRENKHDSDHKSTSNLPVQLKAGIESLSGYSMDDVKVHYNSNKPAQLKAHAFAQGNEIHLASGQEKHLPHEAWHVVQQKQGRVKPTLQLKSAVNVNDDPVLEREADVMGDKAAKGHSSVVQSKSALTKGATLQTTQTIQRQIQLTDRDDGLYEETEGGKATPEGTEFYYVGNNTGGGKPIFALKADVDKLEEELDAIKENDDLTPKMKIQARAFAKLSMGHKAHFYTDDGVFPIDKELKGFRLSSALSHPLFKDPDRARGLQHRFAVADGVLFSKLTKEKVEEELGALPDTVTFYKIPADEWVNEVNKHRGFWTEVTSNYAYGRHMDKRGIVPRDARSKFRQGKDSSTDHNDFSGDEKKALLPPVGPAKQDSGWIEYKAYANPKSRGDGQYKAMGKWNALAYAAYMFHHGHPGLKLDQDWEWLHIRGAQNGGATNLSNLVAGTATTNSRMIPWEDKINSWTRYAKPDHPLSVKFIGERVSGTDLGKLITISIAAEKGIPGKFYPVSKSVPLNVSFNPLNGTVFDRVSNKITAKGQAREAFHNKNTLARAHVAKEYVSSRPGKVKYFRVIGRSPYKGYQAEFRQYYRQSEAVVIISAVHKQVVMPLDQLKPWQ